MRSLGVASGLNLVLMAAGEGDAEKTDEVTIKSLTLDESLDQSVPLLNKSAKLVTGDVHALEVSVAVESFDFLNLELDVSPSLFVSITLEFSE